VPVTRDFYKAASDLAAQIRFEALFMTGSGRDEAPQRSVATTDKDAERRRLAEALRANLERRKKQKQARTDQDAKSR
jgi:hypothetical protein